MSRRPARTYIRPFGLVISEGRSQRLADAYEVTRSQSTTLSQVSQSRVEEDERVVRTVSHG